MTTRLTGRIYPIIPHCDCWNPSRCQRKAQYDLITDEGHYCPGGPICKTHAYAIVTEYKQKLGQQWGLRVIHPYIRKD